MGICQKILKNFEKIKIYHMIKSNCFYITFGVALYIATEFIWYDMQILKLNDWYYHQEGKWLESLINEDANWKTIIIDINPNMTFQIRIISWDMLWIWICQCVVNFDIHHENLQKILKNFQIFSTMKFICCCYLSSLKTNMQFHSL